MILCIFCKISNQYQHYHLGLLPPINSYGSWYFSNATWIRFWLCHWDQSTTNSVSDFMTWAFQGKANEIFSWLLPPPPLPLLSLSLCLLVPVSHTLSHIRSPIYEHCTQEIPSLRNPWLGSRSNMLPFLSDTGRQNLANLYLFAQLACVKSCTTWLGRTFPSPGKVQKIPCKLLSLSLSGRRSRT